MRSLTIAIEEARIQIAKAEEDINRHSRIGWQSAECAWAKWRCGAYRKALRRLDRVAATQQKAAYPDAPDPAA